ncbi:MAG TPA: 30S ribosomal protein S4 [Candidatus Paceibacterota bacterium]|nr:30S ribosomal protein S4 [Candidatus Paceibacterota bacterium]
MLRIKSKYKIAKRLGSQIFEQTQTQKFALSEARSKKTHSGGRSKSDYGRQLMEKQKVRFTYGISEKQLANYAAAATKEKNPPESLHQSLEMRLDSAAYRAGFALTRRAARQLVSHGHLLVNSKRITTPSYRLKKGDTITVREGSRASVLFAHMGNPEASARTIPTWLSVDLPTMVAKVEGEPGYSPAEIPLDYPAVFEFYSR